MYIYVAVLYVLICKIRRHILFQSSASVSFAQILPSGETMLVVNTKIRICGFHWTTHLFHQRYKFTFNLCLNIVCCHTHPRQVSTGLPTFCFEKVWKLREVLNVRPPRHQRDRLGENAFPIFVTETFCKIQSKF